MYVMTPRQRRTHKWHNIPAILNWCLLKWLWHTRRIRVTLGTFATCWTFRYVTEYTPIGQKFVCFSVTILREINYFFKHVEQSGAIANTATQFVQNGKQICPNDNRQIWTRSVLKNKQKIGNWVLENCTSGESTSTGFLCEFCDK